jgi:hypothetical protein
MLPNRFQLSLQPGFRLSNRDGKGVQVHLGFTFRSRNYFPNSGANTIYHGIHFETMLAQVLGIPLPPSSIYTGQSGVTVQPATGWFVLGDRWHILTPSTGIYAQIPFNPPASACNQRSNQCLYWTIPQATHHWRFVGIELFHFDIIKTVY